jgi:hypothetical protein
VSMKVRTLYSWNFDNCARSMFASALLWVTFSFLHIATSVLLEASTNEELNLIATFMVIRRKG